MSGIADDINALLGDVTPPSRSDCKLCWYLPRLEDIDRVAIEGGLRGTLSAGKIADIMTKNGRPLSKSAVQRHQAHMTERQEPTTA